MLMLNVGQQSYFPLHFVGIQAWRLAMCVVGGEPLKGI